MNSIFCVKQNQNLGTEALLNVVRPTVIAVKPNSAKDQLKTGPNCFRGHYFPAYACLRPLYREKLAEVCVTFRVLTLRVFNIELQKSC